MHLPAEFSSQISRNMFGHSAVVQPAGSKFLVGARPLARSVEMKRPGDLPCEVPAPRILHLPLDKNSCSAVRVQDGFCWSSRACKHM